MKLFDPVVAAAQPYLIWIKLAFIASLFLGGLFTGCHVQKGRDAEKVTEITESRDYYKGQGDVLAKDLAEVNKQYKANAQAAREWRDRAQDIALAAAEEKKKNQRQQDKWEAELAKLKKDPDCKAILEMKLCKSITSF